MKLALRVTVGIVLLAVTGSLTAAQHRHEDAPAAAPRSDSIYELPASLVDQDGRPVGLDLFRGHPVLITMFYTSCRDACPMLVADLKRFERELSPRGRADLRIVLVSLDAERDTPEALRRLAAAHDLDTARWRLLRASEDTVREIAAVLGIHYRRLPDGTFNHSSVITLVDARGVALARVEGLGQPLEVFRERLHALR
jgi:protein SCO1/2